MLALTTNSSIDLSLLLSQSLRGPPPSQETRRYQLPRRKTKRPHVHSWTDEELDLLSYLRHLRYWRFKQIKETYFPSLSLGALSRAYWRLSPEDRIRRAAVVSARVAGLRNAAKDRRNIIDTQLEAHDSEHELSSCSSELVSCSESYTENDTGTSVSTLPTPENELAALNHRDIGRYNLRPKRPTTFPQRESQYLVDRYRFPHFYKSYKYHLESSGLLDEDYCPPSRTPTPRVSDQSPSVISTQLSEATFAFTMTDIVKFEQFGLNSFYNAIPILDNANDWFKWSQKVKEFIRISAVADDGTAPPEDEEEAQKWTHRQKFYSAMITAKLSHDAAQRINAFNINRVQALLKAVKDNFKPEGSGIYVQLQRRYMSLTRAKCGSIQALGAEIRKIHAEKLLLDRNCVTSEIERIFFFLQALGPEYESFRDHTFRQTDMVNVRDEAGNITTAAPTFDSIENKAIEEEHRKGQLGKQPDPQALPTFALTRKSGDRKITPSADGITCIIETIQNAPYCSFCQKPYHVEAQCFKKNPKLREQQKDSKGRKAMPDNSQTNTRNSSKRRSSTDDEDDNEGGPRDPKRPTFMATKVSEEDVNTAFGKNIEGNLALFNHTLTMMATKSPSIHDAWIVDSGCAQHICNTTARFVHMEKYYGPPLQSVNTSTTPSGVGTVNILCNVRGRRKWLVLDNVLFVPSAHANLISVLQLLKQGAKVEFSSQGASIRNKSNGKNLYTASQYHGVYALDVWTNHSFPAYHVSPQMTLWHHRLAHMSDANLRRLKKQAYGVRDVELGIGCYHMTCKCRAEFCYRCGVAWKNCSCERWNEERLVARAEEVVDRDALQPLAPRDREIRVAQMQEDLRENHELIADVDLNAKFVGIVIENTSFNVVTAMCKFVRTVEEIAYDIK
uniref:Copia protein n=1 Tax=Talaromyces marneffei PM1 TaxID=1077442 RepID=A0A093VNJ9_TALMA